MGVDVDEDHPHWGASEPWGGPRMDANHPQPPAAPRNSVQDARNEPGWLGRALGGSTPMDAAGVEGEGVRGDSQNLNNLSMRMDGCLGGHRSMRICGCLRKTLARRPHSVLVARAPGSVSTSPESAPDRMPGNARIIRFTIKRLRAGCAVSAGSTRNSPNRAMYKYLIVRTF